MEKQIIILLLCKYTVVAFWLIAVLLNNYLETVAQGCEVQERQKAIHSIYSGCSAKTVSNNTAAKTGSNWFC